MIILKCVWDRWHSTSWHNKDYTPHISTPNTTIIEILRWSDVDLSNFFPQESTSSDLRWSDVDLSTFFQYSQHLPTLSKISLRLKTMDKSDLTYTISTTRAHLQTMDKSYLTHILYTTWSDLSHTLCALISIEECIRTHKTHCLTGARGSWSSESLRYPFSTLIAWLVFGIIVRDAFRIFGVSSLSAQKPTHKKPPWP